MSTTDVDLVTEFEAIEDEPLMPRVALDKIAEPTDDELTDLEHQDDDDTGSTATREVAPQPAATAEPTASTTIERPACQECGEPVPPPKRRYCGDTCSKAAEARTHREKHQAKRSNKPSNDKPRGQGRRPAPYGRRNAPAVEPTPPTDPPMQPAPPTVADIAAQLLASGTVAEVELTIDGATIKARCR